VRSILTVAALSVALAGAALAQQGEVYKIGGDVKSPILIKEVKPNYTGGAMFLRTALSPTTSRSPGRSTTSSTSRRSEP